MEDNSLAAEADGRQLTAELVPPALLEDSSLAAGFSGGGMGDSPLAASFSGWTWMHPAAAGGALACSEIFRMDLEQAAGWRTEQAAGFTAAWMQPPVAGGQFVWLKALQL